MTPLASLPWYDLKETRCATDFLWRRLARNLRREGLGNIPESLNREIPYERQWALPGLLFGQACGYDVLIAHADKLKTVATPRYTASGCQGAQYSSFVVVRENSPFKTLEDLRGSRCVINSPTSHSGMNVLRALVTPLHSQGRFFGQVQISGSHEVSLSLILQGEADVAAIDCVTHALLTRHRPQALSETRILCQTLQVPAPPYVTSVHTAVDALQRLRVALAETLEDPGAAYAKEELFLDNVEFLPLSAYRPIGELEKAAWHDGYREFKGVSRWRIAREKAPLGWAGGGRRAATLGGE